MADDQVTQPGNQGVAPTQAQTDPQSLGWRAGLPDDLKNHEAFVPHKTVGDLGKVHIEVMQKVKELEGKATQMEGKLSKAIFKPGEKSTPEEVIAYRQAMQVPDKPEGYEFPKREGEENDPNLISWAQKLFHKHNLPKDVAFDIGGEWNAFLTGVEKEEDRLMQVEIEEAQKKFRGEFKTEDEFKAALELNKRYYKKVMGTDIPPFMDAYSITKFLYEHAKKYGEGMSPPGSQTRGTGDGKPGMVYDRTPQHNK